MIKVMLVDDHSILRSGLRMLLNAEEDLEVVGEASCGEGAISLLDHGIIPDLILLDLSMPGMGGLAALKEIKEKYPQVQVLVLTMHDDEKYLPSVLEAGASGYVVKKAVDSVVINAIRTVARGEPYIDDSMTGILISGLISKKQADVKHIQHYNKNPLSPREEEVLKLLCLGHTNKQIAEELVISVKTVEAHKAKIKTKLNLTKRSDLTRYAINNKLIEFNDTK